MLNELLKLIETYFYSEHKYEPLEFELVVTPDPYGKRLELAMDEKDRAEVIKSRSFIETLNGTVALPQRLETPPTIILNEDAIKSDLAYIETIVHEMTHLFDYRDLANYIGATTYDELRNYPYQGAFYYWTEFHARRYGYQFYGKLLWKETYKSQERLTHIQSTEAPFQMKHLVENLGRCTNDGVQYMYSFMQYMGRYSVWEDLFPSSFYGLPVNIKYEYNGLLSKIYSRLCEYDEFDLAKGNFKELHELFDSFG